MLPLVLSWDTLSNKILEFDKIRSCLKFCKPVIGSTRSNYNWPGCLNLHWVCIQKYMLANTSALIVTWKSFVNYKICEEQHKHILFEKIYWLNCTYDILRLLIQRETNSQQQIKKQNTPPQYIFSTFWFVYRLHTSKKKKK